VHGDAMSDHSFVVHWQGQPIVLCQCSLMDGVLGLHGLPMRVFMRSGLDVHVLKGAIKTAFAHLDALAERLPIQSYWLRERSGTLLGLAGEAALGREALASVALVGIVDLTAGVAVWKKALRKSFQQFVNWGRKSFAIRYVNAGNCTDVTFDPYRHFHAHVAGRVTRPKASWDVMQSHVREGRGELILAELDGKLAAGSLFIDGTDTAIYMNGVYDRDLDKPLAHYMIWHGMERAAARGMAKLHLGDVHQVGAADDKRYAVGYFKRGFTTDIEQWTDWRWSPKA
jgi:Acetyltransferase (GNAT) domain